MFYSNLSLTSISTVVHVIVTLSTVYGKACKGLPVVPTGRRRSGNTKLVVLWMTYILEPTRKKQRKISGIYNGWINEVMDGQTNEWMDR